MYDSPPPHKKSSPAKETHIAHLMTQREHLLLLQSYMSQTFKLNGSEFTTLYQGIADLLAQTANQYGTLINMLEKKE